MAKDYRDIRSTVSKSVARFREGMPDVMKSFNALGQSALREGALDSKTKELIALCLGVAGHCDACLAFHVKTLVQLGATRAEIEEALGVCVYMGGGPSLMYAADALEAFEQWSVPEQVAGVDPVILGR
jgi:AhpD family alkylhydroperoxidase